MMRLDAEAPINLTKKKQLNEERCSYSIWCENIPGIKMASPIEWDQNLVQHDVNVKFVKIWTAEAKNWTKWVVQSESLIY